jgi:hypothetical protein
LLEDEENPPEEGLTALGLLGVEERDEEKPLDDEERDEEKPPERDEENPLPLASIAGSKIIDSPRIRYLIYFFIGFVMEFNIQGVFLLSRPFCNFS